MTNSPVRRSSRTRQQPKLQYEAELEEIAKKRRKVIETSSPENSEAEEDDPMELDADGGFGGGDGGGDDDDDDDDDDDEEEFNPNEKKKSPKKSPTPRKNKKEKKATPPKKPKRTIQVKIGRTYKTGKLQSTASRGRRGAHTALSNLAKKVLGEEETPATHLVAALLASSKPIEGIPSFQPRTTVTWNTSHAGSTYTPQLEGIARHLLQEHEQNSMHIQLLNLLFRSVGGSAETNIPAGTDLEDLEDSEWDQMVTNVVEVMRETDADQTLLCAVPTETVAMREYRLIYQEFWYRLGNVILSHSSSSLASQDTEFSSNRFQVEMMRELVSRITELVLVGQPDLRSGATMAIWQLSLACIERTVELEQKLEIAARQSKAAKSQSRKFQALQLSIDAWRRHKAELEEIVEGTVFHGVFIHRYRDSNPHIRAVSLQTLSNLTLLRPDIFLRDKYLKYFGWMAHDKDPLVRLVALQGLVAPFRAVAERNHSKRPSSLEIDIQRSMRNVCTKFLNRFVDCTEDSKSLAVQEIAMELLLAMLKHEFLDEWEDDEGWDQVNLKALDPNTTPKVRLDALYFILEQLHSFDSEDDNRSSMSGLISDKKQAERLDGIAGWIANKLCDGPIRIEDIRVHLADHVVHSLRDMSEHKNLVTNWSVMLKAIRSENPHNNRSAEGREEVTKQRVLLRMLACAAELELDEFKSEKSKTSTNGNKSKKRKREGSHEPHEALSVALLKALPTLVLAFKGDIMALRSLSQLPRYLLPSIFSLPARKSDFSSLVKNLSVLFLETTDEKVLQNIAHALVVLVQGDHARVAEVRMHIKKISTTLQDRLMDLFAESDPEERDTSSSSGPKKSPRKSSRTRRRSGRVSELASTSSSLSSDGVFSTSHEVEVEHAISLCLLRMRVLLKKCPLKYIFPDTEDEESAEQFCNTLSEALGKRLLDRKPIVDDEEKSGDGTEANTVVVIPDVWKKLDVAVHHEVSKGVGEGLQVMLCVVAWKLLAVLPSGKKEKPLPTEDKETTTKAGNEGEEQKDKDEGDDEKKDKDEGDDDNKGEEKDDDEKTKPKNDGVVSADEEEEEEEKEKEDEEEEEEEEEADVDASELAVARIRQRLIKLLLLCFDQHLEEFEDGTVTYTDEHVDFASHVQAAAGRVASDVRTLFPREWSQAADPFRRALALTEDSQLIGGFARYVQSREHELLEIAENGEAQDATPLVKSLLMPLIRSLAANWGLGNRKEAAIVLAHITGSGIEATQAVQVASRLLKKIDPVRFLEAQMICLRSSFDSWLNAEPEELTTDRPTEEQLRVYEEAEKHQESLFLALEQQAARLSMGLGVGKISDTKLSRALLNFMQEGVRFAFEGNRGQQEDDLVLGSRLPFLVAVSKYSNWIRKTKSQLDIIRGVLIQKETDLYAHPEFDEVHEDDIAALESFKESLGILTKRKGDSRSASADDQRSLDGTLSIAATPSPTTASASSSKRRRMSTASSQRSRMSIQSNLSPLYEEEGGGNDDDGGHESDGSPSPQKQRRLLRDNSLGSSVTMSIVGKKENTIEEEEEPEVDADDDDKEETEKKEEEEAEEAKKDDNEDDDEATVEAGKDDDEATAVESDKDEENE